MKTHRWDPTTLKIDVMLDRIDSADKIAGRFRLADILAQIPYGDEVQITQEIVQLFWPPTGDHDRSFEGAFRAIALSNGGLRPETSYTSIERIERDLPQDGSYVVKQNLWPPGIWVGRLLRCCPRCRGRGAEQYWEPEETVRQAFAAMGEMPRLMATTIKTRECDHKPK